MALITNYTTLKTAIADYLARSDLTDYLPNFIQNCEAKLLRTLRLRFMETALNIMISSGIAALPDDYLDLKHAYLDLAPVRLLERTTPETIYRQYPLRSGSGVPRLVAREAGNLIFGPYPDSNYTIKGIYWAKPTLLSDDDDGSNWLTENAPELLLYGSLMEAAPFLKNDQRIAVWQAFYNDALTRVQYQEKQESVSGGSLAVKVE